MHSFLIFNPILGQKSDKMKKILGLGNALTDILLQVSEDDLRELGFPKGSMNLISR